MFLINFFFIFLQLLFLLQVAFGDKAFANEADFHHKIMEKKNNMQSFERIREVLEKHKASELVIETVSPLSSMSVSSGYIVYSQYEGKDSLSGSCDGSPYYLSGTALGLCVAVNSGYSGLPYGCSSSGSYVMLTSTASTYDSTTEYLTYSYYSSSDCSTSCGSKTYYYTNGCTYDGYSYGYNQSYSFSLSSNMVLPSVAGTLTEEFVSSSCSGTLAGYYFYTSICRNFYGESYKITCSSDTNTQQYDYYYYNTNCSGVVSNSDTYDFSYKCAANPYAIIADSSSNISMNNADSSSHYYYSDDGFETIFYKYSCQGNYSFTPTASPSLTPTASSSLTPTANPFSIQSSSSTTKLTQTGVIVVSVVSVVVFLVIVGLHVFLFFNYCYKQKNTSNKNNNGNNNNTDNFTSAVEIVDANNNQKV
jgi:hypothetical protein